MKTAKWNGTILAQSDKTIEIEGNHYFPPESFQCQYLKESSHMSTCPWKGLASYYDIQVDGEINSNAGWFYKQPSEAAHQIKDYVAFWKGVEIT
jgi:uncharacterized protein (DUF427 family)